MQDPQSTTNYSLFKCLSTGCNKNISVESFLSNKNYSKGMSYLQKEGIDLIQDLTAIDVICPFCSHTNHFRVTDRVREMNMQEYDAQSDAVKSTSSRINISYKVNTQPSAQSSHSLRNIPREDALKAIKKAKTTMPPEGMVLYNHSLIFDKFRGLERKEFKR